MNDDIGKIARRFNEMSLQNKKLIEELVQAEAQKNSAKMEAVDYKYRFLHTQINPHFIYNSLETINAIAKVNHTPEVSRIVQLIGKYFRNITKYSDHQFIALEKEFELLQCFIDIYKNIRGSNIEIRLDYPQELKSVEIPTMLLQPIVENAIYHGLDRMVDEGRILIRIYSEGEDVVFRVEDNGVGMSEEQCRSILHKEPGDNSGIGIKNVNDRIKIYFGKEYGLSIESELDEGTTVIIRMPKVEENAAAGWEKV